MISASRPMGLSSIHDSLLFLSFDIRVQHESVRVYFFLKEIMF